MLTGNPRRSLNQFLLNPREQATAYRTDPAGPQEEQDWANALENVLGRIMTLESTQRSHAKSLADHQSAIDRLVPAGNTLETRVMEQHRHHEANYQQVAKVIEGHEALQVALTSRVERVEMVFNELRENPSHQIINFPVHPLNRTL